MKPARSSRRFAASIGVAMGAVVIIGPPGCSAPPAPIDEQRFVSSGVVVPSARSAPSAELIGTHPALLAETEAARPSPPVRIAVPGIGVDASVDPVGVRPDGELTVPRSPGVAGWYRAGPSPAATAGSAVIAGHVDFGGKHGVFYRLVELRPGDPVVATDATGASRSFIVSSVERYAKADLPTGELFRRSGPPTLTLITCGGEFRPSLRSYADNLVVRAVPG